MEWLLPKFTLSSSNSSPLLSDLSELTACSKLDCWLVLFESEMLSSSEDEYEDSSEGADEQGTEDDDGDACDDDRDGDGISNDVEEDAGSDPDNSDSDNSLYTKALSEIMQEPNLKIEEVFSVMENLVPLKRIGDPKEFAYLVTFLASEKASYINGINIPIDGGLLKSLWDYIII